MYTTRVSYDYMYASICMLNKIADRHHQHDSNTIHSKSIEGKLQSFHDCSLNGNV